MSFNPSLATDVDWVRALIGDTVLADEQLEDETIEAFVAEATAHGASASGRKYCAAAMAGEALLARWLASGKGVAEERISKLTVRYGSGAGDTVGAFRTQLKEYRSICTRYSLRTPQVLKVW